MKNIEIIFEDSDVLVINKPAGLVVHSDGRTKEKTLADWLIQKYSEIKEVGETWESDKEEVIYRPGIVHRLDRDTSGVMIIAKTQESYEFLKEQFQERKAKKEYHVFVNGLIKEDEGVIERPIGKSPADFRRWSAQPGARGVLRDAITEYEVLKRTGKGNDGFTYLVARPRTGRTHQIRVHLKALHHPVVADTLYGLKKAKKKLGFKRQALHAQTLTIETTTGAKTFEAPLPEDFAHAIDLFE